MAYFENTITKLTAVKSASEDYRNVISGVQGDINDLTEEIAQITNKAATPQDGENFAEAFIRQTERAEELEKQKETKEKALKSAKIMAEKTFPFSAKEIVGEFVQRTEEYKSDSLSVLESAAIEAKEKYEHSLELVREAYREQMAVSAQVKQVTEYVMGETIHTPQLKILPSELFLNKEHAKIGRYA